MNLETYKSIFLEFLKCKTILKEPENLYKPTIYILNLGGKRLRPILTLMACKAFSDEYKNALPAALAIEVFHNFTLVHDDIMDHADLRRGEQTVHKKWDINTGILSGDAMMLMTNQLMEHYDGKMFKELMVLFNKTALEVCEGQQYDIDFETKDNITISNYLNMISLKTAVLIGCALKMGAIIAGTNEKDAQQIYNFGLNLGIAFQLQDDYLDTFGDAKTFGKKIGGDILENKKTFLYLKALELSTNSDKEKLLDLFSNDQKSKEKIKIVTIIYNKYKIQKIIQLEIQKYTKLAFDNLSKTSLDKTNIVVFKKLGENLLNRTI